MNRSEIATALGVSEKTVARYVTAGRLPARYVRGKTGQQLDVDEDDVQRLKNEMETPVKIASDASATDPTTSDHRTSEGPEAPISTSILARVASAQSAMEPASALTLSALARIVRAVMDEEGELGQARTSPDKERVPIQNKLLLTLDEAVALSGLPRAQLNTARREGKLKARRIGRGYKVRRDELESFVAELWHN